jgi:hypothetical protein
MSDVPIAPMGVSALHAVPSNTVERSVSTRAAATKPLPNAATATGDPMAPTPPVSGVVVNAPEPFAMEAKLVAVPPPLTTAIIPVEQPPSVWVASMPVSLLPSAAAASFAPPSPAAVPSA